MKYYRTAKRVERLKYYTQTQWVIVSFDSQAVSGRLEGSFLEREQAENYLKELDRQAQDTSTHSGALQTNFLLFERVTNIETRTETAKEKEPLRFPSIFQKAFTGRERGIPGITAEPEPVTTGT